MTILGRETEFIAAADDPDGHLALPVPLGMERSMVKVSPFSYGPDGVREVRYLVRDIPCRHRVAEPASSGSP